MLNLFSQREKMVEDKSPEHAAKHRREAANHHKAGDTKRPLTIRRLHMVNTCMPPSTTNALQRGMLSSTAKKAQRSRHIMGPRLYTLFARLRPRPISQTNLFVFQSRRVSRS